MTTAEEIRALPWKGNARDDLIAPDPLAALSGGSKSTYDIASEMIANEPDANAAWEAEKALHWCCFGMVVDDSDRDGWERDRAAGRLQ